MSICLKHNWPTQYIPASEYHETICIKYCCLHWKHMKSIFLVLLVHSSWHRWYLWLGPHMVEEESSLGSPSWTYHLPKPPPSNTITLGVCFQCTIWKEVHCIQAIVVGKHFGKMNLFQRYIQYLSQLPPLKSWTFFIYIKKWRILAILLPCLILLGSVNIPFAIGARQEIIILESEKSKKIDICEYMTSLLLQLVNSKIFSWKLAKFFNIIFKSASPACPYLLKQFSLWLLHVWFWMSSHVNVMVICQPLNAFQIEYLWRL